MDTGKIMIGIAMVMLSIGLLTTPTGATLCDNSCSVGSGSAISAADVPVTPYTPQARDDPAVFCAAADSKTSQWSAP
jgi:hypothetical protein